MEGTSGKNKLTPNENAVDDYIYCFDALFDYVDYFVVNVSSPNTPNLASTCKTKSHLTQLLSVLKKRNDKHANPKPILLKIAPDLSDDQLLDIISIMAEVKIDGVIASNTTLSRANLKSPEQPNPRSGWA